MTKEMKLIADYCKENVCEFEERVQMALRKIDHWRCPLQQADSSLYDDIQDAVCDCATDYEIDVENIDIESIIWL